MAADGPVDTSVDVPVYDIDGFDNSPRRSCRRLHREGRKVICYLSTGAWEDFRPDAGQASPSRCSGAATAGRGSAGSTSARTDVLEPLMADRLDMCRDKGFDAVEPDNMDGYSNAPAFG